MGMKSSLVRIGSSLLLLTIFSGTASSSDTNNPESVSLAVTSACDVTDCAQELQPCQAFCALLFNRTAVQRMSLAPRQLDYSVTDIPRVNPSNTQLAPKEAPWSKGPTKDGWPIRYRTAAAETAEPSGSQSATPTSAETPQPHWSHLPIWGAEAEAKGYGVPLPFGIGATFYDAKQPVTVKDLKLGAGGSAPESATFVKINQPITSWQQNVSTRFDVWLFPFVNVYGIAGYTRGNTRGRVTVTGPVFGLLNEELPLLAEFHGPTVGGGLTLAIGHKMTEWHDLTGFLVADANHTVTFLSFKNETLVAETKPHATVAAIRGGVRGEVTKFIYAGMWVGGMYQSIQEEVAGSVAGRQLEFIINQRASSPWNTLVGGQIEFGKHFNIIVEGGFGPRSQILTGAALRF